MAKTLRLVLGDQLNSNHSWYKNIDPEVVYLMMEMRQETDYVRHHVQKLIGFFLSMRNFSSLLETKGHQVIYIKLDDAQNTQKLDANIHQVIASIGATSFAYQLPDEYRLDVQLKEICDNLTIPSQAVDSEHFLTERGFLGDFLRERKPISWSLFTGK